VVAEKKIVASLSNTLELKKAETMNPLSNLKDLTPTTRQFAEAIQNKADAPIRLAKMSEIFKQKGHLKDAEILAKTARRLAPNDTQVRLLTDWFRRQEAPPWHFNIVHDEARNRIYDEALKRNVKPGMIVFEIGTGTGLLAMLAARAGAAHVYTCER
jgi:type II protein arginine methyltransferase